MTPEKTEEELRRAWVAENYCRHTVKEMAEKFSVGSSSISRDIAALKLRRTPKQRYAVLVRAHASHSKWTPETIAILKKHYATKSQAELMQLTGAQSSSIYCKAKSLGLSKSPTFVRRLTMTAKADARREYVREHYGTTPVDELAVKFGVAVKTIELDRRMSGLAKKTAWTEAALTDLRRLYPDAVTEELAVQFGISVSAIKYKAEMLGLRKSKAYYTKHAIKMRAAKDAIARDDLNRRRANNLVPPDRYQKERIQYQAGHTPWKADRMFAQATGLPDLSYRGQRT